MACDSTQVQVIVAMGCFLLAIDFGIFFALVSIDKHLAAIRKKMEAPAPDLPHESPYSNYSDPQ